MIWRREHWIYVKSVSKTNHGYMPPNPSRRALLSTSVGLATIGTAAYAGARFLSKTGTVVVRHVSGQERERGALSNKVDIAHAELNSDGTIDREVHTDYRDLIDPEETLIISDTAHRSLTDHFDTVRYYLGHRCPNAECSTPAVNRGDFNDSHLGETVRLLYHGTTATVVPT